MIPLALSLTTLTKAKLRLLQLSGMLAMVEKVPASPADWCSIPDLAERSKLTPRFN